jgi:hypothetical protein
VVGFLKKAQHLCLKEKAAWLNWRRTLSEEKKTALKNEWASVRFFIMSGGLIWLAFNACFLVWSWQGVAGSAAVSTVKWVTWFNTNAFLGYALWRIVRETVEAALGQDVRRIVFVKKHSLDMESEEERRQREQKELVNRVGLGQTEVRKRKAL